jgi:hypothetical protein
MHTILWQEVLALYGYRKAHCCHQHGVNRYDSALCFTSYCLGTMLDTFGYNAIDKQVLMNHKQENRTQVRSHSAASVLLLAGTKLSIDSNVSCRYTKEMNCACYLYFTCCRSRSQQRLGSSLWHCRSVDIWCQSRYLAHG